MHATTRLMFAARCVACCWVNRVDDTHGSVGHVCAWHVCVDHRDIGHMESSEHHKLGDAAAPSIQHATPTAKLVQSLRARACACVCLQTHTHTQTHTQCVTHTVCHTRTCMYVCILPCTVRTVPCTAAPTSILRHSVRHTQQNTSRLPPPPTRTAGHWTSVSAHVGVSARCGPRQHSCWLLAGAPHAAGAAVAPHAAGGGGRLTLQQHGGEHPRCGHPTAAASEGAGGAALPHTSRRDAGPHARTAGIAGYAGACVQWRCASPRRARTTARRCRPATSHTCSDGIGVACGNAWRWPPSPIIGCIT